MGLLKTDAGNKTVNGKGRISVAVLCDIIKAGFNVTRGSSDAGISISVAIFTYRFYKE